MKINLKQIYENEWIFPFKKFRSACCDCGLVHDFNFRFKKKKSGQIEFSFKVKRNFVVTKRIRKNEKIKITKNR